MERELAVKHSVRDLIHAGLIRSAHDCSEGGLAVALAESCFNPAGLLGADIKVGQVCNLPSDESAAAANATLFGEAQSRIVISVAPENIEQATQMLRERNVP